ncbi:MAG: discoidin domain-containing protein, partial [Verrucomicrobia bacterium]|nr:discoidin domain-containing protein [Verrucomicrobiota bacterium]
MNVFFGIQKIVLCPLRFFDGMVPSSLESVAHGLHIPRFLPIPNSTPEKSMKPPTSSRHRFAWLLASAGLLPGALHADVIRAHPADAKFLTGSGGAVQSGPVQVTNNGIFVGREYYGDGIGHIVVPFQLPDLGEGTFSDVSASFHINDNGGEGEPNGINANLFLRAPNTRTNSTTLTTDVNDGTNNHTTLGQLIKTNFLTPSTAPGRIATPLDGAEETQLNTLLNQAYANGDRANNFIFLRLSPAGLNPGDVGPYSASTGFSIATSEFNHPLLGDRAPQISYTFTPVDPNAPTLANFRANKESVNAGGSVTLSWTSTGADSITIQPGSVNVTGQSSVSLVPSATTTYTITASNSFGSRTRSTSVTVTQVPLPITQVGTTTTITAGGSTSTSNALSISKPTGAQAGDLLIASVSKNGNVNNITSSGWTSIQSREIRNASNARLYTQVLYRVVDGSEGASFSFLIGNVGTGSSNGSAGAISAFRGVDLTGGASGGPFSVSPGSYSTPAQSNTTTANSITPAHDGSALIMVGGSGGVNTSWSAWNSANHGSMDALGTATRSGTSSAMAWKSSVPQGATGNSTATISTISYHASILLALKAKAAVGYPSIDTFTINDNSIDIGDSVTLSWSVSDATSVSLNNGIGSVSASGSLSLTPVLGTTYTLTATNANGSVSRSVSVAVNGPGPYRYYRFITVALRGGLSEPVQLSEFQLLKDGVRVPAVTVTNPGGQNTVTASEGANKANDNDYNSKWHDSNKAPLVYDMGGTQANWNINGYRFVTGGDASERDPTAWRLEGSHDNATWAVVDAKSDFFMTESRNTEVGPFNLTPFPVGYPILGVSVSPDTVALGSSTTISWNAVNADSVSIDNGVGPVSPATSGSVSVSPTAATTYEISATNSSGTTKRTVSVFVAANPILQNLANHSFESDVNPDAAGSFANGGLSTLSGWTVVTRDNSSSPSSTQTTVGDADLVPADGGQALGLMSGAVVCQLTNVNWNTLGTGDLVRVTVAAGDRATNSTANPRWADESFFGLSNGLVAKRSNSTPAATNWLDNVVARGTTVSTPPGGYKSGTMGDLSFTYAVTAADSKRSGKIGVFIASLGNRDDGTNGADAPSSQSFWDNVRFELIAPPGPTIQLFDSNVTYAPDGNATLSWNVLDADSVSINNGVGTVSASGSLDVTLASSAVYTLTATNSQGTRTRSVNISVPGVSLYRYFRFTPVTLRGGGNMVQLSEFEMLLDGARIAAVSATNPGGSNGASAGEGALKAIDNNPDSKWLDANKQPLILDFGKPAAANGYRFITSNDGSERDPVSWTLEGSNDNSTWSIVDQQTAQTVTTNRKAASSTYATLSNSSYASVAGAPVVNTLSVSPGTIKEGESATLTWDVSNATSVRILGIGAVAANGSQTVSPNAGTAYTLVASNSSGTKVQSAILSVNRLPRGDLLASFDDAVYQTDRLDGSIVSGPDDELFSIVDIGRFVGDDVVRHLVIPFQLPNLGTGAFKAAELKLNVYGSELGNSGRTTIQLFAIPGSRADSATLDSDVVDGAANALSNGYLIKTGYLDQRTTLDTIATSGSSGAAASGLAYWLNEAYSNGANAGDWVFIRLSPDALDILPGFGFGVSTGDDSQENAPKLSYVFDPDGGAPTAPVVSNFSTIPGSVIRGESATLYWSVFGADSVTIDQGIGSVSGQGSAVISPNDPVTYTLIATNAYGTTTVPLSVGVFDNGSYQYFRFTTLGVRGDYGLALSELQFRTLDGTLITGATATAPGSNSLYGGSLPQLVDGDAGTYWSDANSRPIILDFGQFVTPATYRLGTGGYGDFQDPTGWRVEGSRDGNNWDVIDTQTNQGANVPTARGQFTQDYFILPGIPEILQLSATPSVINPGESATLSWIVTNVDDVTITGLGTQPAGASVTLTPSATTTYQLSATAQGVTRTKSVTLYVANTGLLGYTFAERTGQHAEIVPISNIFALTPSGRFVQEGDLTYADGTMPATLPGLSNINYFSVLWTGWIDISIDGPGDYTFGTDSDDGSVIHLDRNNDGDFNDTGERIVLNSNSVSSDALGIIRGTVNLTQNTRIAIAYYDGLGGDRIAARFKKGNNVAWADMSPIGGSSGHFVPREPVPGIPDATLSASATSIVKGAGSTLTWTSSGATSVSIDNGIGTVAASGSLEVFPTTDTTYTLTASNSTGPKTVSVTITVLPPGVTFSASPLNVAANGDVTLTWTTTGADSASIDNGVGSIALNDSTVVNPAVTTTYTLTAVGDGSTTATVTVTVVPPPSIFFEAASTSIVAGQFVNLNWVVTNATSVSIDNGIGTVTANSSRSVNPSVTTTYTLSASGFGGSTSATVTITVAQPPSVSFTADEPAILEGGSTTIRWTVGDATSISINNSIGSVSATGSLLVTPSATTSYVLTATNAIGDTIRSVTVSVFNGLPKYYNFDDLTFQGWSDVSLGATGDRGLSTTKGHGGPHEGPGLVKSDFWDEDHPTLILRSPAFTINNSGNLTVHLSGGRGGSLQVPVAVSSLPANSVANTFVGGNDDGDGEIKVNGFMGVALRNASTGQYVWSASKTSNGNAFQQIILGAEQLAALDQQAVYTLDFIDAVHGAWGWTSLDTVTIPGNLVTPPPTPGISVTGTLTALSSTYGSASTADSFTLEAILIGESITITAPAGFEVSTEEATGYGSLIVVEPDGDFWATAIYVRLAANVDAGSYSGDISITSPDVTTRTIATAESTVSAKSLTITANAVGKTYGDEDPELTYSSDGLVGDDAITGALGRDAGENAGAYAIGQGSLDAGSNYTISYTGADLTISPKELAAGDITLTRDGNAYTASAAGVSGFTYSYSGRDGTSYGPSADAPTADGDYTVTATVNDP